MFKPLALGILAAAACLGQAIHVAQGSDPAGQSKWVNLTLAAVTSYPKDNVGRFTPSLTVRCEAKGKPGKEEWSVNVLLDTGGVASGTISTRANATVALAQPKDNPDLLGLETLIFPMKFDSKNQKRTWELLPKSTSVYAYMGEGDLPITPLLSPTRVVEKLLSTNVFSVQFQPLGASNTFDARFVTSGLKKEFQQHKECSLK